MSFVAARSTDALLCLSLPANVGFVEADKMMGLPASWLMAAPILRHLIYYGAKSRFRLQTALSSPAFSAESHPAATAALT